MNQQVSARPAKRPRSIYKSVVFRLAAVLLSLSPLVLVELSLVALDIGRPSQCEDPFVGFSAIHPLFELSDDQQTYRIAPARLSHFRAESFAAKKSPREFRIFVLGGSTVQGRPYSIESSFTTWLEKGLAASSDEHDWQVVNCGGVSYASYRLLPILEEVLQYEPDLVIFCEGHNEFLESRSYDHLPSNTSHTLAPAAQLSRFRSWNLLRQSLHSSSKTSRNTNNSKENSNKTILPSEATARLDWEGGMASFERDATWHAQVIEHYAYNIERMIGRCQQAKVPLVMVHPVSNLEWSPFKSEHTADLTESQKAEFDELLRIAAKHYATDLPRAIAILKDAARISPDHAQVHYELGICYQLLGDRASARHSLLLAKELDVCPLRMLEPMSERFHAIVAKHQTPCVDLHEKFTIISASGYPSNEWLIDHVHPTIEGHQKAATWILEQLAISGVVRCESDWESRVAQAYREHLATLDHVYFERGKARLASEQGWARGKVRKRDSRSASKALPTSSQVMP